MSPKFGLLRGVLLLALMLRCGKKAAGNVADCPIGLFTFLARRLSSRDLQRATEVVRSALGNTERPQLLSLGSRLLLLVDAPHRGDFLPQVLSWFGLGCLHQFRRDLLTCGLGLD